jgi:SP family xylose:H+ symportor-like MFS transporter
MAMDVWPGGVVPSAIFLIGVTWLPESPRWLMKSGQAEKAKAILNKIGSSSFAEVTFKAVEKSLVGTTKQSYAMVLEKSVRPAVVVGITLAVFQQFCGINVVFQLYLNNI